MFSNELTEFLNQVLEDDTTKQSDIDMTRWLDRVQEIHEELGFRVISFSRFINGVDSESIRLRYLDIVLELLETDSTDERLREIIKIHAFRHLIRFVNTLRSTKYTNLNKLKKLEEILYRIRDN